MNLAYVLAVVFLLWFCVSVKGDDDINSCEIFLPANFNISIGKMNTASIVDILL